MMSMLRTLYMLLACSRHLTGKVSRAQVWLLHSLEHQQEIACWKSNPLVNDQWPARITTGSSR